MLPYSETVQRLFLAYLGYPADPPALANWNAALHARQGDTAVAVEAFARAVPYQARVLAQDPTQHIDALYHHLFQRAASDSEVSLWQQRLDSRLVTVDTLPWVLQAVARGEDAALWQTRLTAAQAFSAALQTPEAQTAYSDAFWTQYVADWLAQLQPHQSIENEALSLAQVLHDNYLSQYGVLESLPKLPVMETRLPVATVEVDTVLPLWLETPDLVLHTPIELPTIELPEAAITLVGVWPEMDANTL